MYAAHTQEGLLIYASEAAQNNGHLIDYFCPNCHHSVSLKFSSKGKAFFSHKGPCYSHVFNEGRPRGESESHLSAKALLAEALMNAGYEVSLEYYFEKIQQTADLFVYGPHMEQSTYIIEFQRSPISAYQLQKRQNAYLSVANQCLWLIDEGTFRDRRIKAWHKTMVRYSKENSFHWFSLNIEKRQLVVKYHVPILYLSTDCALFEVTFGLDNLGERSLDLIEVEFSLQAQRYQGKKDTLKHLAHYQKRLRQLRSQTAYQATIHQLYGAGCLLQALPHWMLTESWQCLVTKTPGWLVFAWSYCLILQFDQVAESFSNSAIHQAMARLIKQGSIDLVQMPFVEVDVCFLLTEAILEKLLEKEVIMQLPNNEWRLVK